MPYFPRVHLWMTLPFVIAIAGFYFSYWSRLSEVPYHQHLHGLTATLWYALMIIQPWLAKKKNLTLHRQIGFAGLFLAGGVVFSALQVVGNNLSNENLSPVLKYGLTWGDFIFIAGFSHAVIMAMVHSKTLNIHARYMMASALWAILPALSRLIYFPVVIAYGYPPPVSFLEVIYLSVALSLAVIAIIMIVDYQDQGKIYASFGLVAGGILLFGAGVRAMGEAAWWIEFCDKLLR